MVIVGLSDSGKLGFGKSGTVCIIRLGRYMISLRSSFLTG